MTVQGVKKASVKPLPEKTLKVSKPAIEKSEKPVSKSVKQVSPQPKTNAKKRDIKAEAKKEHKETKVKKVNPPHHALE